MKKLKGITINGEWLGDNVVINANFRAICNLAPFVMQEFAKLVNSIEKLESAVTINSFYFPDNNTVDIEFSNNNFSGLANLCFHLQNGLPELVNRSLTVYTEELKTTEEGDFKDSEEIFDKVKEIIIEQLGVPETAITTEASFIDDLGADSLDIVELIMALEEEFDLEIPDSDAEKVVTVGDVVEYIKDNV